MTTRAQLESEREALILACDIVPEPMASTIVPALTASIERVEALLEIPDAVAATDIERDLKTVVFGRAHGFDGPEETAAFDRLYEVLRTVANLIRREPRGDV